MMGAAYNIAVSGCQGALKGQHSALLPHGPQRRATRNRLMQKSASFRRMWRPSMRWTTLRRAVKAPSGPTGRQQSDVRGSVLVVASPTKMDRVAGIHYLMLDLLRERCSNFDVDSDRRVDSDRSGRHPERKPRNGNPAHQQHLGAPMFATCAGNHASPCDCARRTAPDRGLRRLLSSLLMENEAPPAAGWGPECTSVRGR